MSLRHRLDRARLLAAGTALAAGGLVSMATPAGASTQSVNAAKDVSPMTIAPSCIRGSERSDLLSRYADLRNTCNRTFRVKAIIAFSWDGPCVTLDPGEGYTHTYSHVGRLDRIDLC